MECLTPSVSFDLSMDNYFTSFPLLAFLRDVVNAIYLEYSKKGKLSPSHIGIQNIPSDIFWSLFVQKVTA